MNSASNHTGLHDSIVGALVNSISDDANKLDHINTLSVLIHLQDQHVTMVKALENINRHAHNPATVSVISELALIQSNSLLN